MRPTAKDSSILRQSGLGKSYLKMCEKLKEVIPGSADSNTLW